MADHHDRIDPRRGRHQRAGDGGAHAGGGFGGEGGGIDQLGQRRADAAHHVAALDRNFSRNGLGGAGQDRRGCGRRHAAGELGLQHRQRRRDRHVVIECRVGVDLLEGDDLGIAETAIGGDDDAGAGIMDAVGQGFIGEAAEDRRVDDPRPLRRLSIIKLLRNVGHVQGDTVAAPQAQIFQNDAGAGDFEQQPPAADDLFHHRPAAPAIDGLVPPVALEDEGRFFAPAGQHVAVDFIEPRIGKPAVEPAVERCLVGIEGAGPGFKIRRQVRPHRRRAGRIPA
jgi:hypothetical protein